MFSSKDLYIIADGHHFVFLTKHEGHQADHLTAFKKIEYACTKFSIKNRSESDRTFDRIGGAHSSYSLSDLSKKSDANYLQIGCRVIDDEFKKGKFSRIILIGDFEILSMMKKFMSKTMLSKVFHEIYKNYSKLPVEVLEKYLRSS